MHFHDSQRKVDYVLAYHYRKRGAHLAQGFPGHSLAIVSNGETGKEPHAGDPGDIELGPLDALEEERKEQREEFEHNLMEAGLELEKDLEVSQAGGQGLGDGMVPQNWAPSEQCHLTESLGFILAGGLFFLLEKPDFVSSFFFFFLNFF